MISFKYTEISLTNYFYTMYIKQIMRIMPLFSDLISARDISLNLSSSRTTGRQSSRFIPPGDQYSARRRSVGPNSSALEPISARTNRSLSIDQLASARANKLEGIGLIKCGDFCGSIQFSRFP